MRFFFRLVAEFVLVGLALGFISLLVLEGIEKPPIIGWSPFHFGLLAVAVAIGLFVALMDSGPRHKN